MPAHPMPALPDLNIDKQDAGFFAAEARGAAIANGANFNR
jgi:hypothetical protein